MDSDALFSWLSAEMNAILGFCGPASVLARHMALLHAPAHDLFRSQGQPYPVHVQSVGIDLMLQCVNPDDDDLRWGVASICVRAGAFNGQWIGQLHGPQATLSDVIALLGAPEFSGNGMAIFEVLGPQGQRRCVHCEFSQGNKGLHRLTLARLTDWQTLPEGPAHSMRSSAPAEVATASTTSTSGRHATTCRSSEAAPRTGWYEASLPPDHPSYGHYSVSHGRFVRVHKGERMLTLGVVPRADEALVVWTWLRDA